MGVNKFFKEKKKAKANEFFPATKSLLGDDGKPILWEIRPLSTREDEEIREACTKEIPIAGRANLFRAKVDTAAYMAKLAVASIVEPDLYDASLQDSYGVMDPESLIKEIVDDPGEYAKLIEFIQGLSGYDMASLMEEAKN